MTHSDRGRIHCRPARGFTLIELMIAVAIIAILVALAVPAYQDYSIRSKVAECVNGAAVAKIQISEYRQALGAWPPTAADAGLIGAGDSQYCDGFTNYADGSFIVNIDEEAIEPTLTADLAPELRPSFNTTSRNVDWYCLRGATPEGYLKYLPATCRSTS